MKLFLRTLCIAFVATPLLFSHASAADDDVEELDPIRIEATRGPLAKKDLPSSITVIDREQIEQKNYINVEDMLREELGLDVVQNGSLGSNTTVFMRGAGSSSTLVMVDGVQVNANTTGAFNFSDILADNLERIEILRGPQSTLWGADAVGGVINLVTRKGKGKPTHSFTFEGGSFSTFKENLSSSGGTERYDYSMSVSRVDTEGFTSAIDKNGNNEDDGYQNTSTSLRAGLNFMEDGRAEFIGRYIQSRVEFDEFSFGSGFFVDGPPLSRTESFYIAAPIEKSITDWWDVRFNPNIAYDEFRSRNQTALANADIFNRTYTLDLQNTFSFMKYYSLILGGEYQLRNGVSTGGSIDKNLENQSVYMQGIFNYHEKLVLTGGFRYDGNDSFENAFTHKLEGAYRFNKWGTRVRAAWATGFRAPTINDLFFPGFSNPDLKPEENESWEAGFDQSFLNGDIVVSSVYFDQNFDNLIQFSSVTFLPINIGSAKSKGVETSVKIKLVDDFRLNLNHTWNDTFNKATKRRLIRRAEHKWHANIQRDWKKLSALLGFTFKSGIEDFSANADAFFVTRIAASYKLNKHLKFTVRGENIFDEEYEEIVGLGTAGAAAYAGFTVTY